MAKRKQKAVSFSLRSFVENTVIVFVLGSLLVAYAANEVQNERQRQELLAVEAQVAQQAADNDEIKQTLASGNQKMLERIARDQYDYIAPNERVFVDMSGR